MFTKQETLSHLLGCLEVTLFMKQGIARFSVSKKSAIKSFLIPFVLLPITLMIMSLKSPEYPAALLMSLHGFRIIGTTILVLILLYYFSKTLKRENGFFQLLTTSNWMNIPIFLLFLPVLFVLLSGSPIEGDIESYAILITILSYVLSAFVVTFTLRIPWELGGAIAIACMFVDQTALNMVENLTDSLVL